MSINAAERLERMRLATAWLIFTLAFYNVEGVLFYFYPIREHLAGQILYWGIKAANLAALGNMLLALWGMRGLGQLRCLIRDEFVEKVFSRAALLSWLATFVALQLGEELSEPRMIGLDGPQAVSSLPAWVYLRTALSILTFSFSAAFLSLYFSEKSQDCMS